MVKKVLVTGASSFLGHHVIPKLSYYAYSIDPMAENDKDCLENPRFEILTPSSKELNLLDKKCVKEYLVKHRPDCILHMAAKCGGIGANKDTPGEFIHDNMKMTVNLFDGIRYVNDWRYPTKAHSPSRITHFYGLGSICGYPKFCPVPFKETDLWNGFPEETNAPYGQAKRSMLLMQQAFRDQFGLKGAHLIPVNMMGEFDHFDLRNSHVIPALIRKFLEAKDAGAVKVEIWGDGTPTREFLYAGDCAEAIVKAIYTELNYRDPINLGTGVDISIRELAFLIRDIVGFNGGLDFTGDVSMNGQPKRRLDVTRAKEVLGFTARTSLKEGIEKTVAWYKKNLHNSKKYYRWDDEAPDDLKKYVKYVIDAYNALAPEQKDISVEQMHQRTMEHIKFLNSQSSRIKQKIKMLQSGGYYFNNYDSEKTLLHSDGCFYFDNSESEKTFDNAKRAINKYLGYDLGPVAEVDIKPKRTFENSVDITKPITLESKKEKIEQEGPKNRNEDFLFRSLRDIGCDDNEIRNRIESSKFTNKSINTVSLKDTSAKKLNNFKKKRNIFEERWQKALQEYTDKYHIPFKYKLPDNIDKRVPNTYRTNDYITETEVMAATHQKLKETEKSEKKSKLKSNKVVITGTIIGIAAGSYAIVKSVINRLR